MGRNQGPRERPLAQLGGPAAAAGKPKPPGLSLEWLGHPQVLWACVLSCHPALPHTSACRMSQRRMSFSPMKVSSAAIRLS